MELESSDEAVLDRHARLWQAQGYEVVRRPSKTLLPPFLSSFMPDAILLGRSPKVIVEVIRKGQPMAERKIRELNALLVEHSDWRLEVLYAGKEPDQIPEVSIDQLSEAVASVRQLAGLNERAGLLLFWATLEAISRRLVPERTKRPQSPDRVVELLAGAGIVTPPEAARLREAARWRNRLIHGDLGTSPSQEHFQTLVDLLGRLAASIERQGSV